MSTSSSPSRPHLGHNIERIRKIRGKKQEFLAITLGISQQAVDRKEKSKTVEDDRLEKVAQALEVPVEAIRNFSEEKLIGFFATTITNHDQSASVFYNPVFNPIEKITELYDQLLKSKQEKIDLPEQLLKKQDPK